MNYRFWLLVILFASLALAGIFNLTSPNANSVYIENTTANNILNISTCANTIGGSCQGYDVLGTTSLNNNLYVTGNFLLTSGSTLKTNGHSIIISGTFTGTGATIDTGTLNNGGNGVAAGTVPGGNGANYISSYAGSGGGGGSYGFSENGGNGGNTLVNGGIGGLGTGEHPGNSGSTPSAPTLSNANILTWYFNGFTNYLTSASGGGGSGSVGNNGGGSVYGIYIQANTVAAPTIVANGLPGLAGANPGGGGGSGGAIIMIAYGSGGYTAGTYHTGGGAASGGSAPGGTGGAGQVYTFAYATPPLNSVLPSTTYPYYIYTNSIDNLINFSIYQILPNQNPILLQGNVSNIGYLPPSNQSTGIYNYTAYEFEQGIGLTGINILNISTNMTSITNALTLNSPVVQYYPNLANLSNGSFLGGNPTSWKLWSYPNVFPAAYGINTIQGSVFSSNQLTFPVNIQLNYPAPFGSFNISLQNNPAVQTTITQTAFTFYSSNTGSGSGIDTREILNLVSNNQSTLSPIFASTNLYQTWSTNNYTIPINTITFIGNNFQVYVPKSNFYNPPITSSLLTTTTSNTNYINSLNGYCPITVTGSPATLASYLIAAGLGAQYTVDLTSSVGGIVKGYLQILSGASPSTATQVEQLAIATSSFTVPLIVGGLYGFKVVGPNCGQIYATNFSTWTSPIYINLQINTTVQTFPIPKPVINCAKTFNSILGNSVITCTGADSTNQIDSWTISLYNLSSYYLPKIASNTLLGSSMLYVNSSLSNTVVYQAQVSWLTSNGLQGSQSFTFNLNFIPGLDTAGDSFWAAIIMLIAIGFGAGLALQPGGAEHAVSNTLFIMALAMFICYAITLTASWGIVINSSFILFMVVMGLLSMYYENKSRFGGY